MTNVYLTLADWARRVGPDGNIDDIAELLSQCNEVFTDMLWHEGNLPTGHKTTVRTGLPSGTWRMFNQGVGGTRSTTAQITEDVGSLEAYSIIDKQLAMLDGNVAATRQSEDDSHMEGMSQQMASAIFYSNSYANPTQFTGLSPRYNTVCASTAQNAVNVIDAGGTQSANASLWLVGWGSRSTFGIFPKGSKAGLTFEDKGDVTPAYDASGNRFEAYTSYFKWEAGMCVKDWRYNVRIPNIDVSNTTNGLPGTSPPDLFALMSEAVVLLPTMTRSQSGITQTDAPDEPNPGINPAWYCNRTVRMWLDIQAIRDKNVLIGYKEYAGAPVLDFRGIPIRVCDALLTTESRVV